MNQYSLDQEKKRELTAVFGEFLDESLIRIIFSNPAAKGGIGERGVLKVKVRPVLVKNRLVFQAEEFTEKQAFHKNLEKEEGALWLTGLIESGFRQAELESARGQARIMVGKKGTVTVKVKRQPAKITAAPAVASHNRQKRYILEEGRPVAFLNDLGVMTEDGKIVRSRYDKFKQINRFLEFIEDILPRLDKGRENVIIDFGCGKSYLTFAMYYYLHELKGYEVRIIGLDLKQDVIDRCNRLSREYGFEKLNFCHGDIASYEGVEHVDMVVTLHACDTATDYALEKAVKWGASVILSVPCCQHELNRQMKNEFMEPVLHYGLIKERMAALYTDALRAEILENGIPDADSGVHRHGAYAEEHPDSCGEAGGEERQSKGDRRDPRFSGSGADAGKTPFGGRKMRLRIH